MTTDNIQAPAIDSGLTFEILPDPKQFSAGAWLRSWTANGGGYLVQGSNAKLVSPANEYCPIRCALIGDLDCAGQEGRAAVMALIVEAGQ